MSIDSALMRMLERIDRLERGAERRGTAEIPRGVPVGVVIDYTGSTAPAGWLLCQGQLINRTTYAALFAVASTTYGAGDGSTTFALPDLRGRVVAGKDDMGGTSANRLTSPINGDNLGAAGGAESHTLAVSEMPSHSHLPTDGGNYFGNGTTSSLAASSGVGGLVTMSSSGGGGSHNNMQPTLVLNKIVFAGV